MEPLMLIMLAAAAALLVSGCLKNLFLQKMMAKFRICNTSRFFWKLLRLPMSFFDQRFSGDIVSREQNNEEIAAILFQRIVPSIMDLVLVCCLMYIGIDGKLRKLKPGAWTGWRKIVRDQAVGDFYDRDGKGQWRRKRNC